MEKFYECKICKKEKKSSEYYWSKKYNCRERAMCKKCSNSDPNRKESHRISQRKYKYPVRENQPTEKKCTNCEILKTINNFNYDRSKNSYVSHCKKCKAQYRRDNRDKINAYKKKRMEDPQHKIIARLSSRIRIAVKTQSSNKARKTAEMLDCDLPFFFRWLEYNFTSYMNYDNYGTYWHLDHNIPFSHYDLSDIEQQLECFKWNNIFPLEKIKNITKGSVIKNNSFLLRELQTKVFLKFISNSAGYTYVYV